MNTFLSPQQEALKNQFIDFAQNELAVKAADLESNRYCPAELMQTLGQKGFLGLTTSKEYGGQNGPLLNACLLAEAIGQESAGSGLTVANHFAVIAVLEKFGSDTQKSRYLPLLAHGEALATLCFAESNAGSDLSAVTTTLEKSASSYTLTGNKSYCVSGAIASLYLVLVKDNEGKLVLCLLDKSPHIKAAAERGRLGLRAARLNDLTFQEAPLPEQNILVGDALAIAEFANDIAKLLLSAASTGMVARALELASQRAKERQQFGKNIGQFQGVQWKLADMAVEHLSSQLQVYRAAWAFDEQKDEFRTYAAMAKLMASRTARIYSGEAVQIFGALGLEDEQGIERFYRDAKALEIYQGTAELQKVIIASELKV